MRTRIPVCLRRFLRWSIGFLTALSLLLAAAWIFREPLLMGATRAWIVDQPPGKADAIVVLGGGEQYRSLRAAELFHAGVAPVILIPRQNERPTDLMQITPPAHDVNLRMLISKGVPEASIQLLPAAVRTTKDEAVVVNEWTRNSKAKKIVIPTDFWHTRRTHWIFKRKLDPSVEVAVVAVNPDDYTSENWWHNEQGLIFLEIEVSKMIYYWFKH